MRCGGCGGGGNAGFPSANCPIPTISCSGFSGPPESYLYDNFSEDRGWWNVPGSAVINTIAQEMQINPPGATNLVAVPLLLASLNPTGAQVVTLKGTFNYQVNTASTYGCGIYMGGIWCLVGYRSGGAMNDAFIVTSSGSSPPTATGLLFEVGLGLPNLAIIDVELMIEADATESRYYLDGVLKYTRAGVLNVFTPKPNVRVCNSTSVPANSKYGFCKELILMGYGLPAHC
jgi:hypothetical protein